MTKVLIAILLTTGVAAVSGCKHHALSPTVGESCPKTVYYGADETYYMNDKICVEMHQVKNPGTDMDGWYYAYVVGTGSEAVFHRETDMWEWAESQPYVRTKAQIH